LDLEYTLPDVSQTVIITRMAGRTPVPEKEEISLLASHHATMVIFLSTGMLEELRDRLIAGGYSAGRPQRLFIKRVGPTNGSLSPSCPICPHLRSGKASQKPHLLLSRCVGMRL
jgi:precorrin-4/cobalt-precorrin-4 C11-methyltransferase